MQSENKRRNEPRRQFWKMHSQILIRRNLGRIENCGESIAIINEVYEVYRTLPTHKIKIILKKIK